MSVKGLTKAVVTGASGFIGKHLVARLTAMGVETIALTHKELDVCQSGAIESFINSETTVFHLAANANVGGSVDNPRFDFDQTLRGFFEVLESARRKNAKIIFPSTASVFDPDNIQPVHEKSKTSPSSPYGAAKLAGEGYCKAYFRSFGVDVRVARLFSVYGEGMRRFLIHDLVKKIKANSKELLLHGNGEQVRDYLYVADAVEGMIAIAQKGEPGEDYNLASGQPVRVKDMALQVASLMGVPQIELKYTDVAPQGEVARWYGDIAKIKKLGFAPSVSLEDGLKRTVQWLTTATS